MSRSSRCWGLCSYIRENSLLAPSVVAAHDPFREAVDRPVLLMTTSSPGARRWVETTFHLTAEILDQLADPRFVPHLGLRGVPYRCRHGEEPEAVIDQRLEEQLFVVQLLAMVERRR